MKRNLMKQNTEDMTLVSSMVAMALDAAGCLVHLSDMREFILHVFSRFAEAWLICHHQLSHKAET